MTPGSSAQGRFSLRSIGPVAALLSGAAVLGQVFGLGRELFVANQVGTSPELDALLIAAVFPGLFGSLLASATSTAIVPAYVALERSDGEEVARRMTGSLIGWIGLAALVATVLLVSLGRELTSLAGPGLSPEAAEVAAGFVPLLAPMALFSALMGLLSAVCQIHGRFRPISAAWVSGPVASFLGTVGLWPALGLGALAVGMTLASAAPLAIVLAYALRQRLLPPITLRVDRRVMGDFLRHASPLTLSSIILQFNVLADRAVASILSAGSVSALRYGEVVIRSPTQAIVPAWSTVAYPALVRASNAGGTDESELGEAVGRSLRYILVVFVPLLVATAALAPLLVELVYFRGAFDRAALSATSLVVAAFAPLLLLMMIHSVFVGTLNAHRQGMVLLANGASRVVLNVVLNVLFGVLFGVAGIALSTSVTSAILLVWLGWNVRRLEPTFSPRPLAGLAGRAMLASLVPGIPVGIVAWSIVPIGSLPLTFTALAGMTVLGAATYLLVANLLGIGEVGVIVRAARSVVPSRLRPAG